MVADPAYFTKEKIKKKLKKFCIIWYSSSEGVKMQKYKFFVLHFHAMEVL